VRIASPGVRRPRGPSVLICKRWRRGSESNRRIKVLQTSPLPLGYRALLLKVASLREKVHGRPESVVVQFDSISPWRVRSNCTTTPESHDFFTAWAPGLSSRDQSPGPGG